MSMVLMKLADIQVGVEAIAKERRNSQQGYNFRGVEDVLNTIHGLLAKHRVVVSTRQIGSGITEERKTKSGGTLITRVNHYEFDFVAEDRSRFTVGPIPGEGMDSGDKASNKTVANAYKYCIFFTFSIPTQDLVIEPDSESPEAKSGGNGKSNPKTPDKAGTKSADGDPHKRLETILNDPVFQTDKTLKKEVEGAKISMKNIKEKKSLQNFLNLWEKKLATIGAMRQTEPPVKGTNMSPEEVVEAVQGELVGASEAFDKS